MCFAFPPGIIKEPALQYSLSHLLRCLDSVVTRTIHEHSGSSPSRDVVELHSPILPLWVGLAMYLFLLPMKCEQK